MDVTAILGELQALGSQQTKKTYLNHGAREPLFGVSIKAMKPLAKKLGRDYDLSMQLYATGNYDAAYLAGMIADPKAMRPEDFDLWMETAYFYMMSDYVVAVTLAETIFAQEVADRFIDSGQELTMSAGWSCYSWLLGSRPDGEFDKKKIASMLDRVTSSIHTQPNRTRYAMNDFVMSVGISYLPLHEEALQTAKSIGPVTVDVGKTNCRTPVAAEYIEKAKQKGRLGFKRKYVRC